MMILSFLLLYLPTRIFAQSTTVLCTPGQCLEGFANTTLGARLSTTPPTHLLPGVYTSDTNPQLLRDALGSASTLTASPGFTNSTTPSLPLNLALQPGFSLFSERLYWGQATFQPISSNSTSTNSNTSATPLPGRSIFLSSDIVLTITSSSAPDVRLTIWDAVPDVRHLPSPANQGTLTLLSAQSTKCTPSCSSNGICTPSGTCACQPGFTGPSCESCLPGFFGPSCQACPSSDGCKQCDDGLTGSGRCLQVRVPNEPAACGCKNGICGPGGECSCLEGFEDGQEGKCSKCKAGFFLTADGDCQVCQLGCGQCADVSGACSTCQSGFSQDPNDRRRCNPPPQANSNGQPCPSGSFGTPGNEQCTACDSTCETCTGPSANECVVCATGFVKLGSSCVRTNGEGVCEGAQGMIADNNKRQCDTCGLSCSSCIIPNFNGASTPDQKRCTRCLPGSFLLDGRCVSACPAGTTVSPTQDACIPCQAPCGSCAGTADFCLSCAPNSGLALLTNGRCVPSCPSGSFPSSTGNTCLSCHSDCASCSAGGGFNQCTSCPPDRPVLSNGRCLPNCAKNQFWDRTSGSCQSCDASCSSCSAAGPGGCLSCSSSTEVLRAGNCVDANCIGSDNSTAPSTSIPVVPGLGVCLSELVTLNSDGSGTPNTPTTTPTDTKVIVKKKGLEWWQILLMALGCAFIFLLFIWCCRRRQKKRREQKTKLFLLTPTHSPQQRGWKAKLRNWRDRVFASFRNARRWNWRVVGWRAGRDKSRSRSGSRSPQYELPLTTTHTTHINGKPRPEIVHLGLDPRYSLYLDESSVAPLPPSSSSKNVKSKDVKVVTFADPPTPTKYVLAPLPPPKRPAPPADDLLRDIPDYMNGQEEDMVNLIGSYNASPHPPAPHTTLPPMAPQRTKYHPTHTRITAFDREYERRGGPSQHQHNNSTTSLLSDSSSTHSRLSSPSMYSQMTGATKRVPDPQVPVREWEALQREREKKNPFR